MDTRTDKRYKQKQPQKRPKPVNDAVWGSYIPDIMRSYPDMPVRGRIVDGKTGKEFRPLEKMRGHKSPELKNWITGSSYDNVVEKMRETADQAIKDLKAGIARLERFIDNN